MLTVGSLFSGIGGIEYGLERTGAFRTIWNCEIEPYPSEVLKKHWSEVPNLGDITKVDWNGVARPDVICGGFPCQDISIAGKGKGIEEGARSGLWREFAKAIRVLRPKYAVIENVPMLLKRGLNVVLADLAETGYDAEWRIISAAEVGAPHKRERLFIIASHPDVRGCGAGSDNREGGHVLPIELGKASEAFPKRDGRFARTGEGTVAGVADAISERCRGGDTQKHGNSEGAPEIQGRNPPARRFPEFSWCENIRRVEDLRNRPDLPEPLLRRTGDGLSSKLDRFKWRERVKSLGNAVVPACAQIAGERIIEHEGGY